MVRSGNIQRTVQSKLRSLTAPRSAVPWYQLRRDLKFCLRKGILNLGIVVSICRYFFIEMLSGAGPE
eukprot:SAG11_NODE_3872_length_2177_cov_10.191049_3_plen_67_part_00